MPQIIMGPSQTGTLDASVKKQAYAFLEKLSENDALPGLHIEPINGSTDERVRTGRVNDFYRAVLFKVQGNGDTAHYVYLGVLASWRPGARRRDRFRKEGPVVGEPRQWDRRTHHRDPGRQHACCRAAPAACRTRCCAR